MIVFSLLYIIYDIPGCFIGDKKGVAWLIRDIVIGSPMYHMWYMYMLIGIYAMVPVIIRFKDSISEQAFYKVAFVFLLLACASRWTTDGILLNWDIGQSFECLGYFTVGYCIRKISTGKSNNIKAIIMIILGVLFELGAIVLDYTGAGRLITGDFTNQGFVSFYSPLIVLASVSIFYGFSLLEIKKDLSKIASMTFLIYLIHAGIWDFATKVFSVLIGKYNVTDLNETIWIPVFTVCVFALSYVSSKLYIWMWNKLDRDKRITGFLTGLVHLQLK